MPKASIVSEPRAPSHATMELSPNAKREIDLMKKMLALLSIVSALILPSCSSATEENQAQNQEISSPTPSPTKDFHPISLDALSQQEFIGTDLKLEKVYF